MAEEKKVLLSVNNLSVKFRVRGRVLTAIRNISLDIYEDESIAIVGESGSGKSVFTKTFAGMLDSNGFVSDGSIIFNDESLADTVVKLNDSARSMIEKLRAKLDESSKLEAGAATYRKLLELESQKRAREDLSQEERDQAENEIHDLEARRAALFNVKQTYDPKKEKDKIKAAADQIAELENKIKELKKQEEQLAHQRKDAAAHDEAYHKEYDRQHAALQAEYDRQIQGEITPAVKQRNQRLAKEIYLSVGRFGATKRTKMANRLAEDLEKAMRLGVDLRTTGSSTPSSTT